MHPLIETGDATCPGGFYLGPIACSITPKRVANDQVRRLARRGGVKRISAGIYEEIRTALRIRLEEVYIIH